MNSEIQLIYFATHLDFRRWLETNHDRMKELYVGFYKVNSGKPSMSWSESVDQALCFGWIDGLRKSIDNERYFIRFTPRKPTSNWSVINIRKVEDLARAGLMKPQGMKLYNLRDEHKSGIYTYENETVKLSEEFEIRFRENKSAWTFFMTLPPSYQKPAINWIMSAKQPAIREKRLIELITDSEASRRIRRLNYK